MSPAILASAQPLKVEVKILLWGSGDVVVACKASKELVCHRYEVCKCPALRLFDMI